MEIKAINKDYTSAILLNVLTYLSSHPTFKLDYIIYFTPPILTLISFFIFNAKIIVTFVFVLSFSISMMVYSLKILKRIMEKDTGNERMVEISDAIKEGSEGFFKVQYGTIFKLSILFGILLFVFYMGRNLSHDEISEGKYGGYITAFFVVFTFFTGAFCSAFAGYSGMWVSVRANIRVATAAMKCYNEALTTCFDGGLFASIINVSLALFGISFNYLLIYFIMYIISNDHVSYEKIPLLLVGFSFGASFVAMFAQLGGGIYTKAADVGADLIGKIDLGIAEDDSRNPAVIADLVGDNVGDCAGQAADLFESISAEILSAMILGSTITDKLGDVGDYDIKTGFISFPLIIHCLDLVVSIIGANYVKTKEGLPLGGTEYQDLEDPLAVMLKGYKVSVFLGIFGVIGICYLFINPVPYAWVYFSICGIIGLIDSYLFVNITQYYTDSNYGPVKKIAFSSLTGHATNIISGLSIGLESTFMPVIVISISILLSYNIGAASNIVDDSNLCGLYGTAISTMGMFVSGVYILSMSGFGPIADNAGGIIEMSLADHTTRIITDKLDAVGNVTKANTKGYSIGSASLACFLLFSAFMDEIEILTKGVDYNKYSSSFLDPHSFKVVDISIVEVFISGLLGAATVFIFSSFALSAVGNAAQAVIKEVRSQIKEDSEILTGKNKPNYKQCVSIVTQAGLKEMVKPGLIAVFSPLVIGLIFKIIGYYKKMPFLAVQCVASFTMFATISGILMAIFFNNAGGAWDNAKKYIESGAHGGKGSESHKAAVTGDTVGDPFKDTAGPSIHILIKLISTISLVMAPLFI